MRHYVSKEHEKKKGKPFDFKGWTDYYPDVRCFRPAAPIYNNQFL